MANTVQTIPDGYHLSRPAGIFTAILYLFIIIAFTMIPFCVIFPIGIFGSIVYFPYIFGCYLLVRFAMLMTGIRPNEDMRILHIIMLVGWALLMGYFFLPSIFMPGDPIARYVVVLYLVFSIVILIIEKKKIQNHRTYFFFRNSTKYSLWILLIGAILPFFFKINNIIPFSSTAVILYLCPFFLTFSILFYSRTKIGRRITNFTGWYQVIAGFSLTTVSACLYILDLINWHPMWEGTSKENYILLGLWLWAGIINLLPCIISPILVRLNIH